MSDIGRKLKIKYGLSRDALTGEVAQWRALVDAYIRQGYSREKAGELAASRVLPGYQTYAYASAADTIEMLLRQADEK